VKSTLQLPPLQGLAALASYRIYHVGPTGRLQLAQMLSCASDAEAIARTRPATADGHARELWEGGRLVGRFSKLGVFTSSES
jgi:hypothetical protein